MTSARPIPLLLAALAALLAGCSAALPPEARIRAADPPALERMAGALRERLDAAERNPDALQRLALVRLRQGAHDEALALAREASQRAPFRADLLEFLGDVHLAREQRFQALLAFQQALAQDADRLSAYVKLGITAHLLGDAGEARRALREALRREPRYYEAHYHLARVLYENRRSLPGADGDADRAAQAPEGGPTNGGAVAKPLAEAERHIREARRIRPASVEAVRLHAHILEAGGHLDEARALLAERLAAGAPEPTLLRALLDILVQRQDWDAAGGVLERLEALGPLQPEDRLVRAQLLAAGGDAGAAAERVAEVLEARPRHAPALVLQGRLRLARREPAAALEPLRTAVEVAPDWPEGHYWKAVAHFRLDQPLDGDLELERALALDPEDPRARLLRIRRLLSQRNAGAAAPRLQRFLAQYPAHREALALRAEYLTLTGDYGAAREVLAALPAGEPGTRFARARLAYLQQRYRAALDHSAALLEAGDPSWEAVYLHAAALGRLERYAEAQEALASRLDEPGAPAALFRLAGELHRRAGERPEALQRYEAGLRRHPRHPGLLEGMSRLAMEAGNWREARGRLEAALEQESFWTPVLLDRLVTVYRELGQQAEAEAALERFLERGDPLLREGRREPVSEPVLFRMRLPPMDWAVPPARPGGGEGAPAAE